MGVKIRTKKNEFPKMEKEFNSLNGKKIQVGVLGGGENAWLAGIHEYGCTIAVTDKMRGWLAAHGLHLKKSTTAIHIPERSFLRTGYDTNIDDVIKRVDRLLPMVGNGMSADDFCNELGSMLADRIKDYAEELSTPPKHPFTLKLHPNKPNPLVQSGNMTNSITYKVE